MEVVSPILGVEGVAAIAQHTNSDDSRRLTLQEWVDFLYANPATNKGPSMCMSSEDFRRNEVAIAELCARGKCDYEVEKVLERMKNFRELTLSYGQPK